MEYNLAFHWHKEADVAVFVAELDADRYAVRKVEISTNGKMDRFQGDDWELGDCAWPSIEEIYLEGDCSALEISKDFFELLWTREPWSAEAPVPKDSNELERAYRAAAEREAASAPKRPPRVDYSSCFWFHDNPNDPMLMYSELDEERWETRRLEIYPTGKVARLQGDDDMLADVPLSDVDDLNELNDCSEFWNEAISKEYFELLWETKTWLEEFKPHW
ncbi:MAG: hypothetical protein IJM30_02730 [Thermoguttaceae bacterium]|nr:hypothetical protein [Thermoguttaceae bacterium]